GKCGTFAFRMSANAVGYRAGLLSTASSTVRTDARKASATRSLRAAYQFTASRYSASASGSSKTRGVIRRACPIHQRYRATDALGALRGPTGLGAARAQRP